MKARRLFEKEEKLETAAISKSSSFIFFQQKKESKSMVSTRRANKKRRAAAPTSFIEQVDDDELERLLVEEEEEAKAEKEKKRLEKKRRLEEKKPKVCTLEMLPQEVLPLVLSFLDSAQKLYELSLLCKSFREAISPELVVSAAVFQGGRSKQAIENIMPGIKHKSIYIPSTFRMLRLILAKSCERGEECCSYNLVDQKPSKLYYLKGKVVSRPFGMSLCGDCLKSVQTACGNWRSWYTEIPRICTNDCNKLLCQLQVETSTGDKVGSIVLFKHVNQVECTHRSNGERKVLFEERIVPLVEQALTQEDHQRAGKYIVAFDTAMARVDAHEQAKIEIFEAKRHAKAAKLASRKLELVRHVLEKIQAGLEKYTYKGLACTYKDLVLAGEMNESTGYYRLYYWPSRFALGRLLDAPSSATKKSIARAVMEVLDLYILLDCIGLLGPDYPEGLKNLLISTEDEIPGYQKCIITHCITKWSAKDILCLHPPEGLALWKSLQSKSPANVANVIYRSMFFYRPGQAWWNNIISEETVHEQTRDAFVNGVVVPSITDDPTCAKQKKLAAFVWTRKNQSRYGTSLGRPYTFDGFRDKFEECKREYTSLRSLIREYHNSTETKAWLRETTPPLRPNQTFSRQDAIDTLYDGLCCEILMVREFSMLLDTHEGMFHHPHEYGFPPPLELDG